MWYIGKRRWYKEIHDGTSRGLLCAPRYREEITLDLVHRKDSMVQAVHAGHDGTGRK
jgi:hypothetical protein